MLHSRLCAAEGRDRPPLSRRDLPSDGPQERGHLASNRSHDDRKPQGFADPGGIAIRPRGLDQRPPCAPVARQGEALPSDRIARRTLRWDKTEGRTLRWDKAEEGHQLSWRIEPRMSPIYAAKVTATRNDAPRIA